MIWPVCKAKRWGGIDRDGNLVVPFAFDRLGALSEMCLSFARAGKVGFLDPHGCEIVSPLFDVPFNRMPEFRNGMAAVSANGRSGFVSPAGTWVVPPTWTRCWDYVSKKALVESEQGYCVLNSLGEIISMVKVYELPFLDDWPRNWDCFPCHMKCQNNILVGFINWEGEILFPPRYHWMTDFYEGVAGYCDQADDTVAPFGLVRLSGDVVVPATYYSLSNFENGLARAGKSQREFGFIDPSGSWAIEPEYQQALPFSDGLACVTVRGRKGFINLKGEMVIEPRFDRQASFHDGLASVEYEGKRAYIDKNGDIVWEARVED